MADEKVLFRNGNVVVTPTRFMIGSKTFAVRNIVSTRGLEIRPGCLGQLLFQKPEYCVSLSTSAGEIEAYKSNDKVLIGDLLEALDKAIAEGGTA